MLTIHKAYEGEIGSKKEVVFVSDGGPTKKYKGAQLVTFIEGLKRGTSVLLTSSNPKDVMIEELLARGVKVKRAHWHTAGVAKGLAPDVIAQEFAKLPAEKTSDVVFRADIIRLSHCVSTRQAIMEVRKAAMLRLKGTQRALGIEDGEELPSFLQALSEEISERKREDETPVDKDIAKLAAKIPECKIFNEVADISGAWNTSAAVMAELVDVSRFPSVSSLWHYAGQHVVDGKAPKRARGAKMDWNPKLRTALWMLGDSLIKNRKNRWRGEYEVFLEEELKAHAEKCPNCKTPQGHCGARARRRVVKEILKEFYILCKTQVNSKAKKSM